MQFESHLGHVFPCSGACGPLNVYKSPFMGPCGGPFLLVATGLAAPSLGLGSGVAVYFLHGGELLKLHDLL
jgi:hypothetical protein